MSKESLLEQLLKKVIPRRLLRLFSELPFLEGEDADTFFRELLECISTVNPKDSHEWFWVRDIAFLNWDIRRVRAFKVAKVELDRAELVVSNKSTRDPTLTDENIESIGKSSEASASLFTAEVDTYQLFDRMISSYELRRDRIIRELESRRERMARQRAKATPNVLEALQVVGHCGEPETGKLQRANRAVTHSG